MRSHVLKYLVAGALAVGIFSLSALPAAAAQYRGLWRYRYQVGVSDSGIGPYYGRALSQPGYYEGRAHGDIGPYYGHALSFPGRYEAPQRDQIGPAYEYGP
jgi:hypothetical protein